MSHFPGNPHITVKAVGQPVRHFVTGEDTYYGITQNGFLFNIIRCFSVQPPIENHDDYFTYLLAECREGVFVLRQRFLMGSAGSWYLEAEIISGEKSSSEFDRIREYLSDNLHIYENICPDPTQREEKGINHIQRDLNPKS